MDEKNSNPVIYHLTYRDPKNFPGWYTIYSVTDGTNITSGKLSSFLEGLESQLNRNDNKGRIAEVHYVTPGAFTDDQKASIDSLLKKHNENAPVPTEPAAGP